MLDSLRQELPQCRLALVGGAVRDLLRHRQHRDAWRNIPDLDLVVEQPEGDEGPAAAHRLAAALQRSNAGSPISSRLHRAYGTVEIEWAGVLVDLATARQETYPVAAGNPVVRFGRLEDDLARRDLTINAMALVLHGDTATLLDPFDGRADLAERRLRFLHPHSLRDDPTRLVRAARYASRLGFQLCDEARAQAEHTLAAWPWDWQQGDDPGSAPAALGTRLRMELEVLVEREPWPVALERLQSWGGLALLDAQLQRDHSWHRRLRWAARADLPPLAALVASAADPVALAERLQLPHRQQHLLTGLMRLSERLAGLPPEAKQWPPSRWSSLLEEHGWVPEAVALALACAVGPRRPLLRWWLHWRRIGAPLSARELMAMGLSPGPALGRRLTELRQQRLDRERR
ncbi:MAG: CCA tRNA nucleotidyltransferase [Synechococcaceae cyanobacterium]